MQQITSFSERIAGIYNYLSITAYLIILAIVIVLAILILILSERQRAIGQRAAQTAVRLKQSENAQISDTYDITSSKHIEHTEYEAYIKCSKRILPATIISIIAAFILILSCMSAAGLIDTYTTAYKHGYRDGLTTNAESLWKIIHQTPEEDKLPEDYSQCIFLIYKFGCNDCAATYNDLAEIIQPYSDVYWIASRSEQGKKFLEDYPVDVVPSAVYIRSDGTPLTYILYETYGDGSVHLDLQAMEDLILAVKYDRAQ